MGRLSRWRSAGGGAIGFVDAKIVERFDCYEGTSTKAKLAEDLYVQGVIFSRASLSAMEIRSTTDRSA